MPKLIAGRTLINWDDGMSRIEVPTYVNSIADNAFFDNGSVLEIVIPDSVRSIGNYAFKMCYSMKKITLPKELDSLGNGAFTQCWALEEVVLPEGVTKIGSDLFAECNMLKHITLPSSIESVEKSAFSHLNRLARITVDPDKMDVIPRASRNIAAITYMADHHDDTEACPPVDDYVAGHSRVLIDLCINQGETNALHYMITHELITKDKLPDAIAKATELRRTEITAQLLELQEQMREPEADEFEWDPFA